MYDGKTVILATGVSSSREIPGESRLLGKGVSYCATCRAFALSAAETPAGPLPIMSRSYIRCIPPGVFLP